MTVISVLGPPGAGKGTQCRPLATRRGLTYLSTGDALRRAIHDGTPLGVHAARYMAAGDLVPDRLVREVIRSALLGLPAEDGLLLDGYPRTLEQAESLEVDLDQAGRRLDAAVLVDAPDHLLVARLSGRRVCTVAGHTYHVSASPPRQAGVCDDDGSPLVQRDDDAPAVVMRRLQTYRTRTRPVTAFYEARNVLHTIDGSPEPSVVETALAALLDRLDGVHA